MKGRKVSPLPVELFFHTWDEGCGWEEEMVLVGILPTIEY